MKKQLGLALAAGLATSAVLVGTGGSADADTITVVTFSTSDNTSGATGVTDTWGFTTPAAGYTGPTTITLTAPPGTTSPTLASSVLTVTGATGATCTKTLTSVTASTVTVDLDSNCAIAGSTPVSVVVDHLSNATTTSQADFYASVTIGSDTGTATAATTMLTGTHVTVIVPASLTFTNSATNIELDPVPGTGAAAADHDVVLGIKTNADNGYDLDACMTADLAEDADPTKTIGQATAAGDAPVSLDSALGFGGSATTSGATLDNHWAGSVAAGHENDVVGYDNDCADPSGHARVAYNDAATNGDTVTITNKVSVAAAQDPGTYEGDIDYVATPNY